MPFQHTGKHEWALRCCDKQNKSITKDKPCDSTTWSPLRSGTKSRMIVSGDFREERSGECSLIYNISVLWNGWNCE
jgi:hypothetical protein